MVEKKIEPIEEYEDFEDADVTQKENKDANK